MQVVSSWKTSQAAMHMRRRTSAYWSDNCNAETHIQTSPKKKFVHNRETSTREILCKGCCIQTAKARYANVWFRQMIWRNLEVTSTRHCHTAWTPQQGPLVRYRGFDRFDRLLMAYQILSMKVARFSRKSFDLHEDLLISEKKGVDFQNAFEKAPAHKVQYSYKSANAHGIRWFCKEIRHFYKGTQFPEKNWKNATQKVHYL